jgi:hypothetical protein
MWGVPSLLGDYNGLMKFEDLFGTWRLIALEARSSNGSISYPLGSDAQGFLMYSPDGYVSVVMCRANRNRFGTQDILAGTDAQLVDAAGAYISYIGRYEIRDGRILHHVEASLFPDWGDCPGTDP